jgi:predicted RecB family nuclease
VRTRLLTPSKVTAWLDCPHYLTLRHEVESALRPEPESGGLSAFARLLMDKGMAHELACLAAYEAQGLRVHRVPERRRDERESFAAWVRRVGDVLAVDADVLYQVPLVHDGMRGIADFLVRVVDEDGLSTWEPVDAKLARREAKPGHVLQLCFYADAVEAATGRRPERVHLLLGRGGAPESLRVDDVAAYWRRLRLQLVAAMDAPAKGDTGTRPEPCAHCGFCEFADVCDQQLRQEDSLVFVAGIRTADRVALTAEGVASMTALAGCGGAATGLPAVRQERLVQQAALQLAAQEDQPPPFVVVPPGDDPVWGRGFEQLPEPDDGDVFLDFEGHPFWHADRGLFFLFGLIEQDDAGDWRYREWWAHDEAQEARAVEALVRYLAERRAARPGMHVYHYNHTERSALQSLCEEHAVAEGTLAHLVGTGAFVDLLLVARNAVQVGAESYGLKSLEKLTGFVRQHGIDKGAGAVVEYEGWTKQHDDESLRRIAAYNEDDVRATRALRDWLVARRPADLPWRAAVLMPNEGLPDLDEKVAALHASGEGTAEHLLGDVLGYWRREWSAYALPQLARCAKDTDELLDEPDVLAGLQFSQEVERLGKKGKPLDGVAHRHLMPAQEHSELSAGKSVLFTSAEGGLRFGGIHQIDDEAGFVDLRISGEPEDLALPAGAVVLNDYVHPGPKVDVLDAIADAVLAGTADQQAPLALRLLRRDEPVFTGAGGPAGGLFTDDVDEMCRWVLDLDASRVGVQGPPGTGKTYRGSHHVHALISAGKRVGITGPSHHAIDNLLEAVVRVFAEEGDELRAVRKPVAVPAPEQRLAGVTYVTTNAAGAKPGFDLVAGTTWLFASGALRDAPVDVLLIDEAGQVSLADALATSLATRSMLLLGDPAQLPQVAQAVHPRGSGASALEHVLDGEVTMPAERGVFISESRRMHPDVCGFISDHVYEGRLTSHADCERQTTALGTGLRWLRVEHDGCSTESPVEADAVVEQVLRLLGTPWTDQHGAESPLTAGDIIVVAPYNDQVALLRSRLDADPATAGVPVGTVDKFQGREAAVVLFTMTTSSAADMPRNGDFLFSRNRLNVAVSRARCLAYLVCTEELLNSRARGVEEMRLLSTLCAYAEEAARQAVATALPAQRAAEDQRATAG